MDNRPARSQQTWTVRRLLAWTRDHFEARGVDAPRLAAELLLARAIDCRRIDLYAKPEAVPTADQLAAFREMVRAAADHKPVAYLTGHKEFYSLDFVVTPDVLIPRPETELVVERALAWCGERPHARMDLLEVGTGSGCIVISIAKRRESVIAIATDISPAALSVAAQNARRHGVDERITFVGADMLELPPGTVPEGGFDLLVSNPPYVADRDRDALPAHVREYEPQIALLAGEDGLDAYRRIARDARRILRPDGTVILEVGCGQADAVAEILSESGHFDLIGCYKDLGGIDRVLQFGSRP